MLAILQFLRSDTAAPSLAVGFAAGLFVFLEQILVLTIAVHMWLLDSWKHGKHWTVIRPIKHWTHWPDWHDTTIIFWILKFLESLMEAVLELTDGVFMGKRAVLVQQVEKGEVSLDWRPDPTQPLAWIFNLCVAIAGTCFSHTQLAKAIPHATNTLLFIALSLLSVWNRSEAFVRADPEPKNMVMFDSWHGLAALNSFTGLCQFLIASGTCLQVSSLWGARLKALSAQSRFQTLGNSSGDFFCSVNRNVRLMITQARIEQTLFQRRFYRLITVSEHIGSMWLQTRLMHSLARL